MDVISYAMGKKAGGGEEPTGTIDITTNGITNVKSYASANVNVQPDLESKTVTITENTTTLIEPTTGKDGLSSVSVITNVSGPVSVPSKDVDFYDYDGTRVYSYTRAEIQELTELPANPSHDGLIAQGWNWSLADIKSYSAKYKYSKVNVGQMYNTSDGKTRVYITLPEERLNPYLGIAINGTATIDWGDGNTETVSGSSWYSAVKTQHNYSQAGDYVIKISGNYLLYGDNSIGSSLLTANLDTGTSLNKFYQSCVTKVEIGNVENRDINYAFYNLYNLKSVTIPNGTKIGSYFGVQTKSLEYITLPTNNSTTTPSSLFSGSSLKNISLPNKKQYSISDAFGECNKLKSITLAEGATSLYSLCSMVYGLVSISIPSGVTSVGNFSFANCTGLKYIDFSNHTSIPTVLGNSFTGIPSDCQIIVPDDLYESWITTSNWPSFASKIVKASEV